jgi:PAS domain-containing protein
MSKVEKNLTNAQILRKNAEEKLKEKQKNMEMSELETDVKKLLHELQVHQIELEMQNEELRQANERAEAALKKYTMLYDSAPMGYFILDSEATICDLNFTGADLLGERRFSLVDSNFKLFVSDESKEIFSDFFDRVFSGGVKESCKLMLDNDKNSLRYVYIEGIITGDEKQCLISVVDISDLIKQNKP